jgi:hypothetical protein
VGDVVHRLRGELRQHRRLDGQEPPAARPGDDVDPLVADQPILGEIGPEGQQRRVREPRDTAHDAQA